MCGLMNFLTWAIDDIKEHFGIILKPHWEVIHLLGFSYQDAPNVDPLIYADASFTRYLHIFHTCRSPWRKKVKCTLYIWPLIWCGHEIIQKTKIFCIGYQGWFTEKYWATEKSTVVVHWKGSGIVNNLTVYKPGNPAWRCRSSFWYSKVFKISKSIMVVLEL